MTSALDSARKMRPARCRGGQRVVRQLQTGLLASLALLAGLPGAEAGMRAAPAVADRPVHAIADRSNDPLANAGLRGRVSTPVDTNRRATSRTAAPSGMSMIPAPDDGPVSARRMPAGAPGWAARPAPSGQGVTSGLRERTEMAPSAVPYARSAISNVEETGQVPRRGESVVIEAPVPTTGHLRSSTGASAAVVPSAAPVAPFGGVVAPAPAPAPVPVVPIVAVPEAPISATQQPNGALVLRWGGPDDFSRYVISVLGPDEATAMRTVRTTGPSWTYPAESQRTDFGMLLTSQVCVRVRSVSDGASAIDIPATCIPVRPAS